MCSLLDFRRYTRIFNYRQVLGRQGQEWEGYGELENQHTQIKSQYDRFSILLSYCALS